MPDSELRCSPGPAHGAPVTRESLSAAMRRETSILTIEEVVRDHIERTIFHFKGNMVDSARALGVDRRTLYRWVKRCDIQRPPSHRRPRPQKVASIPELP